MKKPGFVPFQKKSAGSAADPDGIPGNFDDSLPPASPSKKKKHSKVKGKKRPVSFRPPFGKDSKY